MSAQVEAYESPVKGETKDPVADSTTSKEAVVTSKAVASDSIFEVDQEKKALEEEEFAKSSKYTKHKFTSYNVEYVVLSIITYLFVAFLAFHVLMVTLSRNNLFEWAEWHDFVDDIVDNIIFGSRWFTFWEKVALVIFFLPLSWLEWRKTIATHKDQYRVCWHLIFTRNAFLNYIVWIMAYFVCGYVYGWDNFFQWVMLPFCHMSIWGIHDCFKYILPMKFPGVYINLLDDNAETATSYEFQKTAARGQFGVGIDLGFNLYDCGLPTEDFTRTPREAQLCKFNHAFEKLELFEGARVMDIGCGLGDWLHWLKYERKCHVVGLNLTKGQADTVEDRGIPCLRGSWQSFLKKVENNDQAFIALYGGKFDCITCWDTIEHYFKGKDVFNVKVQTKTYRNLYKFAHFLLDKKSKCGMFWSSTLHQCRKLEKRPWKWNFWKEWGNVYLMNIYYNGAYPTDIKGSTTELDSGLRERAGPQFSLVYEEDKIEDYRMTSMINPSHFGNFVIDVDLRFIYTCVCQLAVHPHFLLMLYNSAFRRESAWMWHVGGVEKDPSPTCPTKLLWQAYKFDPEVDSFKDPERDTTGVVVVAEEPAAPAPAANTA